MNWRTKFARQRWITSLLHLLPPALDHRLRRQFRSVKNNHLMLDIAAETNAEDYA